MARLTQSELLALIRVWIPDIEAARVQAAANLFLQELGRRGFGFLRHRSTVTAVPTTSTTVSVTQGATAVTCTDAAETWDGQVVQIVGSDTWYTIGTIVAGTSFVLSSAFEGATVAGGAATVAFWRLAMPSEFVSVEQIQDPGGDALSYAPTAEDDVLNPTTGKPTVWTPLEQVNTDDALEVGLMVYPDDYYTYIVTGTKRMTRFTGSGRCGLPEYAEDALVKGTLAYCWTMEDKEDRAAYWFALAGVALRDVFSKEGPTDAGMMLRAGGMDGRLYVHRPDQATQ
jgi:hypothetical protein